MKHYAKISAITLLYGSAVAFAAGGDGGGGGSSAETRAPADPVVAAAQAAIAQQDWAGAQSGLQRRWQPIRKTPITTTCTLIRSARDPTLTWILCSSTMKKP